ncbi:MAG: hypothetical protein ACRKGH_07010 [Dehalogenimonas sp.]
MKKLFLVLALSAILVLPAGCDGIQFEDINFKLGSDDEPEKTEGPVRCQLILDTRVVTVMGAYVYPAAVRFAYEIIIPGQNPDYHAPVSKYTDSNGFVRYTTEVITVPSNAYVVIYVFVADGQEHYTIFGTDSEMSYTYTEISQEANRGIGTDLYTLAKSITVVKGSSGIAP